jgi:hypothetical protein
MREARTGPANYHVDSPGRGLTLAYLAAAEVGLSAAGRGGQAFLPLLDAPG